MRQDPSETSAQHIQPTRPCLHRTPAPHGVEKLCSSSLVCRGWPQGSRPRPVSTGLTALLLFPREQARRGELWEGGRDPRDGLASCREHFSQTGSQSVTQAVGV